MRMQVYFQIATAFDAPPAIAREIHKRGNTMPIICGYYPLQPARTIAAIALSLVKLRAKNTRRHYAVTVIDGVVHLQNSGMAPPAHIAMVVNRDADENELAECIELVHFNQSEYGYGVAQ
jgi:hypothetical protein